MGIGDALVDPGNGCPAGCTGFVERFADHIASVLGTRAKYETVATSTVPDAVEVVSKPGPEADKIATADVVVDQVGCTNAVHDPETDIGCTTLLLDTEPGCLAEGVKTCGTLYDRMRHWQRAAARGDSSRDTLSVHRDDPRGGSCQR